MNRAKPNTIVLLALLSALLSSVTPNGVLAQARNATGTVNGLPNGVPLAAPINTTGKHFYAGGKNDVIPSWMLRRKLPQRLLNSGKVTRAPGDNAILRQTVLITKKDPTQQFSSVPAPSQDEHPNFSPDEKYVYFDSDRVSDTDPTENATKTFNLYRMFPDGSGLVQLLAAGFNQLEPNIGVDGTRVAYVGGGNISFTTGLDTPVTSGFNLFVYDISKGPGQSNPLGLTKNNPSGFTFSDVRHPSWSPGQGEIVFAGQLGAAQPYHIFKVNVQTGIIAQLTNGISSDTAPAWSPDSRVIAFTSNANAFNNAGPASATSLNANINQTDIWVITPTQVSLDPNRVTNSSSIVGGAISSNKNAAWSTLRPDPNANIPDETDPFGNDTGVSQNLLAFASNRADDNGDGIANDVKNTFDIYFMHASVMLDPTNRGTYTVITPEAVGNPAIKLRTSTPDQAIDPNDPASRFDPNFVSNEDCPTWPQYINSYRIVYQSDRGFSAGAPGTELNLWASTIFDINAPALLKYSIPDNEIVHVARDSAPDVSVREVSAGEKLRFRVRAVDYESGIESVFIQIKSPESAQKSADSREHKIFAPGPGVLDATTTVINAPYEVEAQAIKPYDNNPSGSFRPVTDPTSTNPGIKAGMSPFYSQRLGGLPAGWPSFNQYLAGIDDLEAFSGINNKPDYVEEGTAFGQDYSNSGSFWMRLWDDGPISLGGHEPEGEKAGDGLYTNAWTTPSAFPSDWILDVIVRDNAIDPFASQSASNWKIYDNVWGFTSQPFQGKGGILYVNDYDCGQRFFQTHFGVGTTFSGSFFSLSKDYAGWPTESWMTEFDSSIVPTTVVQGVTVFPLINFLTPLGFNAYSDALTQDTPGATGNPVTGRYDQWRILCRGPVPDSVLNAYKGHIEIQPADVLAGGTGPRSVFVAERCVIWHSPFSGDLFVGPGTIVDNDTQVRLANYVKTGGRLFLNGQDIAWALSLGQAGNTNAFLNNTFKVSFLADNIPGGPGSNTLVPHNPPGRGAQPIVAETWYDALHAYPGPTIPNDPPSTANIFVGSDNGTVRSYMALSNGSVDKIMFTAPTKADVSDFDATWMVDMSPAIVWVTDSSAAPIISKVVFGTVGWESINPEYFAPPSIELKNRRAEMMHNVGDYLRTGRIVGSIRSINGGSGVTQPVKGVFVRATSNHTGKVVATALTQSDGTFTLSGLETTGGYTIDAIKAGFITQHANGNVFHGGYQSRVDIFLTEAQPGNISGTITLQTSGGPVAGIIVQAQDVLSGTIFTAVSQADGTYTIINVPAGTYNVTTPLAPTGNLDTLGYGSSVPASYPAVVVPPSGTAANINFALTQAPGSISGTVRRSDKPGTDPSSLVGGATITATAVVGMKVYTAVTANDGTYSIPSVDPGTYKVTASAPGFATAGPKTANVVSKKNTVVDFTNDPITGNFALVPIPPGSLSGLVHTTTGVPIAGATVAVVDAAGNVLGTTTTGATQTTTITLPGGGSGSYTFNYQIDNVPAGGSVIVGARKDGYLPDPTPTQTVLINTGQITRNVNFIIDPLNTFDSGVYTDGTPKLSLVSAPYEYGPFANSNVATLFGVPAADLSSGAFSFITWITETASYLFYPTPPADTFHLGRGYFLADSNGATTLSITIKGTPAQNTVAPDPTHAGYNTQDGSFRIALKPGWNLIGEPFPYPVNFLNLRVVGADGTVTDVLTAQSGQNPSLGAALWTFQSGLYQVAYTLDPWRGYWIRAFDNRGVGQRGTPAIITLVVSPSARQDRSVHDTRGVLLAGNRETDGWALSLVASVGSRKSAPATVGQTRAALDTYDRFKLETPPVVSNKNVTLAFSHPEWADKAGNYSADVRSAASLTQKWDFTVTSTIANEPVTLNWPNLAQVSRRKDLILTDVDNKTTVDLRGRSSYTIAATPTGVVRHLRLETRAAQKRKLELTTVIADVHPSRASGLPGSVNISYNTTADATVQVGILKNGRLIRSVDSTTRAAGASAVVWDMRDNTGHTVPGDTYSVEVRAQDSEGHTVRQIVPVTIAR